MVVFFSFHDTKGALVQDRFWSFNLGSSVTGVFFLFTSCLLLGGHAPVIKFVDKETLMKEKQQQLEV